MKRQIVIFVILLSLTVAGKAQIAAGGGLNVLTFKISEDRVTYVTPFVSLDIGGMVYMTSLDFGYLPKQTWEVDMSDLYSSSGGAMPTDISYNTWYFGLGGKSSLFTEFGDDFVVFGYSRLIIVSGTLNTEPLPSQANTFFLAKPETTKAHGGFLTLGLGSSILIGPGHLGIEAGINPARLILDTDVGWFTENPGYEISLSYKFALDF